LKPVPCALPKFPNCQNLISSSLFSSHLPPNKRQHCENFFHLSHYNSDDHSKETYKEVLYGCLVSKGKADAECKAYCDSPHNAFGEAVQGDMTLLQESGRLITQKMSWKDVFLYNIDTLS
jgi:hypothetical protein